MYREEAAVARRPTGWRRLVIGGRPGLRVDVLAGITVTAYLVPQCLAYAGLAGVPPVAGLWVAVAGMLAYAALGTSRQLSVGPESTTAIMVAAAIAPLAAGDPGRYVALAATLAILVGVVCLAAWRLRLGFLADLLSQPILLGYMAGVALTMIASQLGTLTGVALAADDAPGRALEVARRLGEVQAAPLALGLGVVTFLLVLRRLAPLAPGTLLAVVGTAVLAWALGPGAGLGVVGAVPGGLPALGLPAISPADTWVLAGSAIAIAFVAYTDVVLTGRAFARRHGDKIDANREFLALGSANLAAGLAGGFPLSASGSRTAIVDAVGGRSQATGLVASGAVVVVVLVLPGAIALIPTATLAGIVVFAALRLIDLAGFRRLGQFRRSELGLALAAAGGVLVVGVLAGILVAMALSVIDLFARVARPPAAVLGRSPGLAGLHNVEDYPDATTVPGLVVFRYDAPLCFANANDFRTRALAAVDTEDVPVEWFLLNAEAIVELDLTAADAIADLHAELAGRGITFAMARAKQDLQAQLARVDLLDIIGRERIYPTLPVALDAFADRAREG
jgi:sulfate permease, SulP family